MDKGESKHRGQHRGQHVRWPACAQNIYIYIYISADPPACKGKALGECSFSVGA